MKGYAIFTRENTLEPAEMALYMQQVAATFAGKHEDIEGAPTEGSVILEFPSVEAAKAWYDSPAYVEVRKHRFAGAIYHAIILEGV
jgi:uncharacterized protein (DUF1330 family)